VNIDEAMEKAADTLEAAPGPAVEAAPESTEVAPEAEAAPVVDGAPPRARDESGRFAKADKRAAEKAQTAPEGAITGAPDKAAAEGQAKAGGAGNTPAAPPAAAVAAPIETLRAPSSWKPAAREAFARAPREVQDEVLRVDREVRSVMQEAAPLRQFAQTVQQTLAPYESIARANGMDSMSYAGSVLQSAAVLHMGTPQQKAALVASLITSYNIDPEHVNVAMQGQPGAATVTPQPPPVDVNAAVEQAIQSRLHAVEAQRAQGEAESFVQSAPEYLSDVWQDMVEIIEVGERQGRKVTYQQAYDRACKMNDNVQDALSKRKAAEQAKTATAATQQARTAAVSIKSQPAAQVRAKPKGIDGAMAAAAEKLGL
jgi:hypothetical protein